jgi:hypothetical protein
MTDVANNATPSRNQFDAGRDDFSSDSPWLLGNQGTQGMAEILALDHVVQDFAQDFSAHMVDPQSIPGMVQAELQSPGGVAARLTDLDRITVSQTTMVSQLFD